MTAITERIGHPTIEGLAPVMPQTAPDAAWTPVFDQGNSQIDWTRFGVNPEVALPERERVLSVLRSTPTILDGARRRSQWSKGDWVTARQDTDFAVVTAKLGYPGVTEYQALFLRHMDSFILGIPTEDQRIKRVSEEILEVGTSGLWEEDRSLITGLSRAFWEVGDRITESWAAPSQRPLHINLLFEIWGRNPSEDKLSASWGGKRLLADFR